MLSQINIQDIKNIALLAAKKVLTIYEQEFSVNYKEDNSPLTQADLQANKIICEFLESNYPNIPILSEENQTINYTDRKKWTYYWCIDPIDGTKEFIKKNGEFTINIALIHNTTPVLGVVYAPVLKVMYSAKKGEGAFKNNIKLPIQRADNNFIIVASKSHLSKENEQYIKNIKTNKTKKLFSIGSSLKLCMVAEGSADIYPRLSPTMEWDTAAADAIVREAGKMCYILETKSPLLYNKENLLNPFFEVI